MPSFFTLVIGVFGALVVWFALEWLRQPRVKKPATLTEVKVWLENFFGTCRCKTYCPRAREEARQILRFLDEFEGKSVTWLRYEAFDAFDDDALPEVPAGGSEESHLRLDEIEEVCRQWWQKQNLGD